MQNEFLGKIGAELWTSSGNGEVPGSFYFKWMDESDVSASAASPADYILYFSFVLDHLVSTSIDACAALLLLICRPILRVLIYVIVKLQQQPLYKCDP